MTNTEFTTDFIPHLNNSWPSQTELTLEEQHGWWYAVKMRDCGRLKKAVTKLSQEKKWRPIAQDVITEMYKMSPETTSEYQEKKAKEDREYDKRFERDMNRLDETWESIPEDIREKHRESHLASDPPLRAALSRLPSSARMWKKIICTRHRSGVSPDDEKHKMPVRSRS